jgi:hypothetical protein
MSQLGNMQGQKPRSLLISLSILSIGFIALTITVIGDFKDNYSILLNEYGSPPDTFLADSVLNRERPWRIPMLVLSQSPPRDLTLTS